jgi:DNA-binding CsgD family transcriptional regulator
VTAPLDLDGADSRAALRYAGELADCDQHGELCAVVRGLPELVGADEVTMSGLHSGREIAFEVAPGELSRPELSDSLVRGWRDHPLVLRDSLRPDHAARRLSDFVALRSWRRTGLFNDFYRPLGMTRELSIQVAWDPVGLTSCVALHRADRDFSERDRALLADVAPHLRAARARVRAAALAAQRLTLLQGGIEATGGGALIVGRDGAIEVIGSRAQELLERWFGHSTRLLPAKLAGWRSTARAQTPPTPLELNRGERRLRAQLVVAREGDDLILLTEHGDEMPSPEQLHHRLPITPREADVLALLAAGATNDAIAQQLVISRHTVIRHVEHLYRKLDVRTRAAATRVALSVLR